MIVFWDGLTYPFEVQEADILFIAGRVPVDRETPLPFEHVALIAESRVIQADDDLLDLRVYGLPESVGHPSSGTSSGLSKRTGRYWLKDIVENGIGCDARVWNLGGRVDGVTPRKAKYFGNLFALLEGSSRFRFPGPFAVDATLSKNIKTNCLGFVCSFLEYFELSVLAHRYPKYPSPYSYSPRERISPSPGHLAHALSIGASFHPYKPADKLEAEAFARADVTLEATINEHAR